MEIEWDLMGIFDDLPSGKRLQNCDTVERSPMFHGKAHYFDWAMASIAMEQFTTRECHFCHGKRFFVRHNIWDE